jgi:hypothetical protein
MCRELITHRCELSDSVTKPIGAVGLGIIDAEHFGDSVLAP